MAAESCIIFARTGVAAACAAGGLPLPSLLTFLMLAGLALGGSLQGQPGTAEAAGAGMGSEIKIQGQVLGQGAPCVQFRLSTGETISFDGAPPQQFKRGMKLAITGNWMRNSTCMQGRAFRVSQSQEIQ